MSVILISVLILMAMGIVIGVLLGIASEVFHVEVDPKIQAIDDALPGLNCGACGFPGCAGYAKAVVESNANYSLCTPGGTDVTDSINTLMENE